MQSGKPFHLVRLPYAVTYVSLKYVASTLDIVDNITGGRLARRVKQLRDEGLSYELVAARIRDEFDIPTTTVSVHRWWKTVQENAQSSAARDPRRAS
jgi:hypothetical protein